jgi:archaellum component FlaC
VSSTATQPAIEDAQQKERLEKQRQLQLKLRNERKKMEQVLEEKRQKEEEILLKEQKFGSLQDEVEEQRKIIDKLRSRFRVADTEIQDLKEEYEYQKQDLLDWAREQGKELDFCYTVMATMLKDRELLKAERQGQIRREQ